MANLVSWFLPDPSGCGWRTVRWGEAEGPRSDHDSPGHMLCLALRGVRGGPPQTLSHRRGLWSCLLPAVCVYFYLRGRCAFSMKGLIGSVVVCAGDTVSVTAAQVSICRSSYRQYENRWVCCVPIKLYLEKQAVGHIVLTRGLLALASRPDLGPSC